MNAKEQIKEQIKDKFANGLMANRLAELYNCEPNETDYYAECFIELIDGFQQAFGSSKQPVLFSAPGRIEIAGNHTNKQKGCVLMAAINKDIIAAATKNGEDLIQLQWPDTQVPAVEVNQLNIKKEEYNKTESIIRGIASKIHEKGYKIGGLNIYVASNIPQGFSFGSLATFSVLVTQIFNHFYCKDHLDRKSIAEIAQYAQVEYYGKPSSMINQITASIGGFVGIDFRNSQLPNIEKIIVDFKETNHVICIIDSGAAHQDIALEYATITREMQVIAEYFEREYLRDVDDKLFLHEIGQMRKRGIDDRAILRAFHFFKEHRRAQLEISALTDHDLDTFLNLIKESELSSYIYLQSGLNESLPQNNKLALTMALCDELLGAKGAYRIHGAGFSGTIEAFVPLIELEPFRDGIETVLGKDKCQVIMPRKLGVTQL